MKAILIFPHQLFEKNLLLEKIDKNNDIVFIIEDPLYFSQYIFHKQKLIFHRASMKFYQNYLEDLGYKIKYITYEQELNLNKIEKIFIYELVDNWLEKKINKICKSNEVEIEVLNTPMFLNSEGDNKVFFEGKNKNKKTFHENFL